MMDEHAALTDQQLAELAAQVGYLEVGCFKTGLEDGPRYRGITVGALIAEVRRLRDAEYQKLQTLVRDVIAHPERHPEIVAAARKLMGGPSSSEEATGRLTDQIGQGFVSEVANESAWRRTPSRPLQQP